MAYLEIKDVCKSFAGKRVLDNINLSIDKGSFFSLLGKSGCGKTTLLRIIAGLENVDSGSILLDGTDITMFPAQERNIGIVFQNYALFPHMDVFENIAFGLKLQKKTIGEIKEAVLEALEKVNLADKVYKNVTLLSGGEQQRVALARVFVTNPKLVLFDEPLSNLDYGLRLDAKEEIKRLQLETGLTSVFVTHDHTEALSVSDNIAVMDGGIIIEQGTPREIYYRPASLFTAGFVGHYNFFNGAQAERFFNIKLQQDEIMAVLPEHIQLNKTQLANVTIRDMIFCGSFVEFVFAEMGLTFKSIKRDIADHGYLKGERVLLSVSLNHIRKFKVG